MKRLYFYLLLLSFTLNVLGQGPAQQWAHTFNVLGTDEAYKAITLTDGSILVAGSADTDGFLMKLDSSGNRLWTHTYGGDDWDEVRGFTVKQDGSGYILVGFTRSYSTNGDNDLWIIETDTSGNELRFWHYGAESMYDNAYDIDPTSDGGYIVIGDQQISTLDDWDVYLLKLDAELNLEWSATIGSENIRERAYSIEEMIDGGFMITGEIGSPFQQDEVYLLSTDAFGNKRWDKRVGGEYDEEGFCVRITPDRNYIISGQTWSWGTHNGYADMYLMKVDSAGNALWPDTVATFGGDGGEDDSGHEVLVTADNDFAEVGQTQKFTGSFLAWLVKTDADGALQWESYYYYGSGETFFNTIALAPGNKYVMAGECGSDVFVVQTQTDQTIRNTHPLTAPDTFTVVKNTPTNLYVLENDSDPDGDVVSIMWVTTPGLRGTVEISSNRQFLIYTPETDFEGREQFTYTAGDGNHGMSKCRVVVNVTGTSAITERLLPTHPTLMNIYPNPFNMSAAIRLELNKQEKVSLDIYSLTGQHVKQLIHQTLTSGEHTVRWNGRDHSGKVLPSGMYVCKFTAGEEELYAKLILMK